MGLTFICKILFVGNTPFVYFCHTNSKYLIMIDIIQAQPAHAAGIARLIMTAMTDDCCQYLAGPSHSLADFYDMMLCLVSMDDSQYSWRNAFVAVDQASGCVAGAVVGYDGASLHRLRRRFQEAAMQRLQMDYSAMDDETCPGEYYIDSLAVFPNYRRRGIASRLLKCAMAHAAGLGLPAALLVDKGNPQAERLYTSLGFEYRNDDVWGGHEMRHLVAPLMSNENDGYGER